MKSPEGVSWKELSEANVKRLEGRGTGKGCDV